MITSAAIVSIIMAAELSIYKYLFRQKVYSFTFLVSRLIKGLVDPILYLDQLTFVLTLDKDM